MSLGLQLNYRPRRIEEILAALTPNASQPEAVPWMLYDTQQYAQAGSSQLSFFTTLPNPQDLTITNMPIAGALPNPWYFQIQKVYFDVLSKASTSADQTGVADDIGVLLNTGRGIATFTLSDKKYGPYPLRAFGSSGAPNAMIAHGSDGSTASTIQMGSPRDNGGFPMNEALIIPPQTQFGWNLNWVASSAISAATYVSVVMSGVLYRRVS